MPFDPNAYGLFGGHPSEAYVLDCRGAAVVSRYAGIVSSRFHRPR